MENIYLCTFLLGLDVQTHPQYIISAPLGTYTNPIIFVDAQSISSNCSGECLEDAKTWINFFHQLNITSLIALAQDIPPEIRKSFRYLAPSLKSFYAQSEVENDQYFPQVFEIIQNAISFPNVGFPEVKDQMYDVICAELGNCPITTTTTTSTSSPNTTPTSTSSVSKLSTTLFTVLITFILIL